MDGKFRGDTMGLIQQVKDMLVTSFKYTNAGTFTIKFSNLSVTLAIISGFILFYLSIYLLKINGVQLTKEIVIIDYLQSFTRNTSLFSAFIVAIICIIFGKKNVDGVREFNKKHLILKPILYALFFYVLLMFGLMLGIYVAIYTNIFF